MAGETRDGASRTSGSNSVLVGAVETLCLLAALALTIPPPPSEEGHVFYFLPGGAIAVAFFAASRALRHWTAGGTTIKWVLCAIEVASFFAFALVMTTVANMLFAH
jgi:hypothetical protein